MQYFFGFTKSLKLFISQIKVRARSDGKVVMYEYIWALLKGKIKVG